MHTQTCTTVHACGHISLAATAAAASRTATTAVQQKQHQPHQQQQQPRPYNDRPERSRLDDGDEDDANKTQQFTWPESARARMHARTPMLARLAAVPNFLEISSAVTSNTRARGVWRRAAGRAGIPSEHTIRSHVHTITRMRTNTVRTHTHEHTRDSVCVLCCVCIFRVVLCHVRVHACRSSCVRSSSPPFLEEAMQQQQRLMYHTHTRR